MNFLLLQFSLSVLSQASFLFVTGDARPDSLSALSSVLSDAVFTAPINTSHSAGIASLIANIKGYNVTNFIILGTMDTINRLLDVVSVHFCSFTLFLPHAMTLCPLPPLLIVSPKLFMAAPCN